jgi:hypothetical protein
MAESQQSFMGMVMAMAMADRHHARQLSIYSRNVPLTLTFNRHQIALKAREIVIH